ncbi:MAG TPA: 4-hydroxy-tetrahydrodipicolinate reductase [Clostridia bacterium]|nr:4-hydroxy-tetrahydrodipicolinate reductase [Clostridia bacterium]
MNLLINGVNGHMGKLIKDLATKDPYWKRIDGMDLGISWESLEDNYNVVVDLSHPSALDGLLDFCIKKNTPLVIGTTGYSKEQLEQIWSACDQIPILKATNMSLGMNIVFVFVEQIAAMLGNMFDIEIIEQHHNRKKDAPSGSAKYIVESIEKGLGEIRKHQYGRSGECPREKGEIGIHAIRGGNIVGYHEANFINELETVKIAHEGHDRLVFAQGALEAARFIMNKDPGVYTMKDVLDLQSFFTEHLQPAILKGI